MKVVWTPVARSDLNRAYDYLHVRSPGAADRIEERLFDAVVGLADFPQQGRKGRIGRTRELVVTGTPYLIIYRSVADRVEILRVLHGSQRWPPS